MTDRYRIALAQLNPVMGDIAGNLEKARAARAQVMDADVIAFSELFIVGYSPEDLVLKPALQEDARAAVEELAKDTASGPARSTTIRDQPERNGPNRRSVAASAFNSPSRLAPVKSTSRKSMTKRRGSSSV